MRRQKAKITITDPEPFSACCQCNVCVCVCVCSHQHPNAFDVEYAFDETDRGYLEPFGINPIINRNGLIMIYGDRTGYQTVNSDLSFLHVRELLNTIQISCQNVLDEYVFTYNIPTTRAEITSRLGRLPMLGIKWMKIK